MIGEFVCECGRGTFKAELTAQGEFHPSQKNFRCKKCNRELRQEPAVNEKSVMPEKPASKRRILRG